VTVDPRLLSLLRERAGLRTAALEGESGVALVRRRMQAVGVASETEYLDRLNCDPAEFEALAAAVAVPETWLFRYRSSCEWLVEWLRERRRTGGRDRVRLLSAPCATGQEPISLAVCAAVAGWPVETIDVEAVDASGVAIAIARESGTSPMPLRDPLPAWAEPWFRQAEDRVVPDERIFDRIRFERADLRVWTSKRIDRFDVVACRNLLIYLESEARRQVMRTCERRLAEDGVLLLGHADHDQELFEGFEPVGVSQSFAHRRRMGRIASRVAAPPSGARGGRSNPVGKDRRSSSGRRPTAAFMPQKPSDRRETANERRDPGTVEQDPTSASPPATPSIWSDADQARSLADAGRLDEAERLCRNRLADAPSDTAAIELIGCLLLAGGDVAEAAEWFRRLVYLVPGHVEGLLHLASLAERDGDAEQAARLRLRARRASDAPEDRDTASVEGASA
jgi:chemotaxis protein methyltransferase WspC